MDCVSVMPNAKRVKIALMTPELARNGGQIEASKAMAFGGSNVSVDLTCETTIIRISKDTLRHEAARTLEWSREQHMPHDTEYAKATQSTMFGSCACTTTNQILTSGRFEQLHCEKRLDGSECIDELCKYSHSKLPMTPHELECKICTETFGSPCFKCIALLADRMPIDGQPRRCPLVQNAGCNHIFHAHCYFSKQGLNQCPAGCPALSIASEAIPFDSKDPHFFIVHSGSVIDQIPVPSWILPSMDGQYILKDTDVMDILNEKYKDLGPGLTVRLIGRRNTGLLAFSHSTVVSICCSSRHVDSGGVVRFPLNGPLHPHLDGGAIDLHTSLSPIFNGDPSATIKTLGLDNGVQDGDEIILYAVQNKRTSKDPPVKLVGRSAIYTVREDWQPSVHQTERGMASFLSSLLVFSDYLSLHDEQNESKKNMHNRILSHLIALTRFPPAARALHILSLNESLAPEEMRALSETIYQLGLEVCHPLVTKGDQSRVFEGARLVFGTLIERSKGPFVLDSMDMKVSSTKPFISISLRCELSGEPLRDPVQLNDIVVERGAAMLRQEGGALFDPTVKQVTLGIVPDKLRYLIAHTAIRASNLVVLSDEFEVPQILTHRITPSSLAVAIDQANVELQIHAPLSLRDQVITPALSLDEVGYNTVYISRGDVCSNNQDVIFLRPCHGGEVGVDVNAIAVRLEPVIKMRKEAGDWDVDAFGNARADRVDTREVEEAVVIALDLSRSMQDDFNRADRVRIQDEVDTDKRAQNAALERFRSRNEDISDAVPRVISFIAELSIIQSIHRLFLRQEAVTNIKNEEIIDIRSHSCRDRAATVISELMILFARAHWEVSQSEPKIDTRFAAFDLFPGERASNAKKLQRWEDLIAVASDAKLRIPIIESLLNQISQYQSEPNSSLYDTPVPKKFLDPFTGKFFTDPVVFVDGYTYERDSIEEWCLWHNTSPMDPHTIVDSEDLHATETDEMLTESISQFLNGRPRSSFVPSDQCYLITITESDEPVHTYLTLPGTKTALSVLIDDWAFEDREPSESRLWSDARDSGDGCSAGNLVNLLDPLDEINPKTPNCSVKIIPELVLDIEQWYYMTVGDEQVRLDSRCMSRLDIVKQAFEAFVNKSETFNCPIALGLVTFGRNVTLVQDLTLLKENFRTAVQGVQPDGDTPLYDSLSVAHSMLQSFKEQNPNANLRIICLTDGRDVGSKALPHVVTNKLQKSKIIVDSIVVQANCRTTELHGISIATGGYSFVVETLEDALNIVELETVLRSKDRLPKPVMPLVQKPWDLTKYTFPGAYPRDIVTSETCPERKPHQRLGDSLIPASKAAARTSVSLSTDRQKRLMQEVREIVNAPHPAIDTYVGTDLAFWKIVIEAPTECPYAGGTFLAYVDFGEKYPHAAPEIRFITPILHPNINRHGRVCHAALDRGWLVDMPMSVIFKVLYGLLLTPDTDNPLDLHATMEYNDDTGQHALKVHNLVVKFASKDRLAWRQELGEE